MNTTTGNIGFILFERGRRGSLRRLVITILIVLGLMLYVGAKIKIVQLGYRLDALENEKKEIERANRSLRIEASSLCSPARIEEIAIKRLGMIRPPEENVVIVKRKNNQVNSGVRGADEDLTSRK